MLVLNAGIFPASQPIQDIAAESWRSAMTVNVEANLARDAGLPSAAQARAARRARRGDRLEERAGARARRRRLLGLEGGAQPARARRGARMGEGRHPHQLAASRTRSSTPALWTDEVLASRAKAYNLTVEQYKKNNLLRTEVASKDVAELAAEMCGRALRQDHGGAGAGRRRQRARRLMSGEGRADPLARRPPRAPRPAAAARQDGVRRLPHAPSRSRRRSATWWCAARRRSAVRRPSAWSLGKGAAKGVRGPRARAGRPR